VGHRWGKGKGSDGVGQTSVLCVTLKQSFIKDTSVTDEYVHPPPPKLLFHPGEGVQDVSFFCDVTSEGM
jgi:hypothetical protein